jgi:hypothetical protein
MIYLFSMKKTSMELSSTEIEYMAANTMSCKAIWLHELLVDLFDQELDPMLIYYDNQSCIKLFLNLVVRI